MSIDGRKTHSLSFARQISATLIVGLLVLIAVVSLASAYLFKSQIEETIKTQGEIVTRMLADNSRFLLLLPPDSEEALQATQSLSELPPVAYVELVDTEFRSIVMSGDKPEEWSLSKAALPVDEMTVVHDGACCWHYVAPVHTRETTAREVLSEPTEVLRLGYIHVATRKSGVAPVVHRIILTDGALLIVLSVLLAVALLSRVKRLSEPLVALAAVMERARKDGSDIRADVTGPTETQNIAETFNELMAYKASQSASLEQQVQSRTHELESARDEALQAERAKSEIMAMFTHEMKAPLHAMGSYISDAASQIAFIKDPQTAERLRVALQIIESESRELLKRINRILDLRALEAGHTLVNVAPVHLQRLVADLEETARPLASERHNQPSVTLRNPMMVHTDEALLLQVLENLVSNACSFTEHGEINVVVDVSDHMLDLLIEDTGVGIDPSHHEQIFTPFYQVDMSDTRTHSGTGLGLAIVRRVTELLEATLVLNSLPNEGTRFDIQIPLAQPD